MFFSYKIKSIKDGDKVLEVGPGGNPHPRSDILLDLDPTLFGSTEEAEWQRGKAEPLQTDKRVVYYDGKKFPFKDNEFDYVIASHVLEHVDDVSGFLSELFRVGSKGYIEYPTVYYDFIYDIPVHYNFLKKNGDTIFWMKKSASGIGTFNPVQKVFRDSAELGYTDMIDDLVEVMIEGFEWSKPLKNQKTKSIEDLVWNENSLKPKPVPPVHTLRRHISDTFKFYTRKNK